LDKRIVDTFVSAADQGLDTMHGFAAIHLICFGGAATIGRTVILGAKLTWT